MLCVAHHTPHDRDGKGDGIVRRKERMRSEYWGGKDWWALQSYPWFRYRSRYAYLWQLRKRGLV